MHHELTQKHCHAVENYREALVAANLSDHANAARASAAIWPPRMDPVLDSLFNSMPVDQFAMPQSPPLHASMSTPPNTHSIPMDIDGGPYLQLADKLRAATRDVITCVLGESDRITLLSRDDNSDASSVGDVETEGILTLYSVCHHYLMHS